MHYGKFDNTYVLRLDKGEEIIETLKAFCTDREITLATISGIGAVDRVTLGLFETGPKRYVAEELTGEFELTSLTGNITTMAGEVYIHLHAAVSDIEHRTYGGHLSSGRVSATLEIVINTLKGTVDREFSEAIGLNLMKLAKNPSFE